MIGCDESKKESLVLSKDLENALHLIVEKYEDYSANNDKYLNPSVYEVHFEEINDTCFLTIATNYFYRDDLNAVDTINGNLIAYYNLKNKCNTLISGQSELDSLKLKSFLREKDAFDNYSPSIWRFQILNDSLVPVYQNRLPLIFE